MIVLAVIDLDLALKVDSPLPFMDKREIERCERSNPRCIMIKKKAILEAFRGLMFEKATMAKEFLVEIEQRFVKNEKIEISRLLTNLIPMRYMGKGNI